MQTAKTNNVQGRHSIEGCGIVAFFLKIALLLIVALNASSVSAQFKSPSQIGFDHKRTGFSLEGSHSRINCESCHLQGIFKGTPKDCASCHRIGDRALGKSSNHISTNATCDKCHTVASWSPANFRHRVDQGVSQGSCASCHNGAQASGKSVSHISTGASCDSCHKVNAWLPALFNHANVVPGNCNSCHNGTKAVGMASGHIPTGVSCDSCHVHGFSSFTNPKMNHAGTAGTCSTCHSGAFVAQNALAKPVSHIATTAQCDSCHFSTVTWSGAKFSHGNLTPPPAGRCSSCHNGSTSTGKPANHIPTTGQCDSCHTSGFTSFTNPKMNHTGTAGTCSTCHSGAFVAQNALTKPATHIATTAQCDTCHTSTVNWTGANFNHTTLTPPPAGRCSSCHNGSTSTGKPANHIPTTGQCDSCHTSGFTSFTNPKMNHTGTAGTCSTCHSGAFVAQNALTKPATHIATTAQCDTCHTSTVTWSGANFNHSTLTPPPAGRCSSCHNGSTSTGKPANHIPTTGQCDSCHTSGFTSFTNPKMNHTGTAGTCATCHSGAFVAQNALTKPATHIGTTAQCDTCHTSTVTWSGANFNHSTLTPPPAGRCSSCHNGSTSTGKPANHIPTTGQCDSCHTSGFTSFTNPKMNHTGTAGTCSTCHSGAFVAQNALTKPATHIGTTAQCDTCHTSTVTWTGANFNHTTLTPPPAGRCSSCHNGSTAIGKPASHIPTSGQCDSCHTSGFISFASPKMNHTGTTGTCSTCHSGAFVAQNAQSKPVNHIPTSNQCDTCHTAGFTSFANPKMNHTGTAGTCSTCHSGAFVAQNALAKPATHIATTAQCDTCHTSTVTWTGANFNHTTLTPPPAGRCSSCHNGSTAIGKPASHIPTSGQCDSCHTSGFISFASPKMNHIGTAGTCASCHNGAFVAQNAQSKPASHIPTGAQCDVCHSSGFVSWTGPKMNHGGTISPLAKGNCSSCHNGSFISSNAVSKPATHISTTSQCDACHMTSAWKPASFSHTGVVSGTCINCHNGTSATGKSSPHIPTTQSCDSCHRTLAWMPLLTPYSHNGVPATGCVTCHTSSYPNIDVKPANHVPTAAACESCHHSFTTWLPVTYNHTGVAKGTCASCHGGAYANITIKPSNHIPTISPAGMPGDECSLCHSSTSSFAVEKMNHGTMQTGCITCHDASATYAGRMTKSTRTANHHGANAVGKDCSSSGCHRPLGNKGSTYTKWN